MSMELIDKRKLIEKVKTFHKWCIHTDNFPTIPSKRNNVGYLADDVLFGIELEPTVKAIPIEVLEQIRNEIENVSTDAYITDTDGVTFYSQRSLTAEELKEQIFEIIDKAIKEQTNESHKMFQSKT